ncbi:RteC protein [Pontibacter ummariensis]|uniref:RteC protein n=1 Tax=Pontibacter ummariensis TaxID=1610492 RepID=A0A239LG13_9BACT|nr:RteC domain-containing protein [Pontibacter ummariensis]PRY03644.1 RteC protein [Pontibacter ummariensis]SNT28882.1 RteC protein [Pontibacter ummariensis]
MREQAEKLYDHLVAGLREAEAMPSLTTAQRHETNLKLLNEAIQELKKLVIDYSFQNEADEIEFFRYIKPKFTSLLIYHSRLALIELRLPLGSLKDVRKHYENELLLIRFFYDDHLQFYHYLNSGATFLDAKYFVRGNCDFPFYYSVSALSTSALDTDTRFTTHYDFIVACFQASERLRDYLVKTLMLLEGGKIPEKPGSPEKGTLRWTGPKIYLVELVYALHVSGQLNNGNIGLTEIVHQVEEFFQMSLGNVFRSFQEMRQRKKDSRIKLLDVMKERLVQRMDELDEE